MLYVATNRIKSNKKKRNLGMMVTFIIEVVIITLKYKFKTFIITANKV